jgi:hypothetical protein
MKRYGTHETRRAIVMLAIGALMSAAALLWSVPTYAAIP